LFAKPDRIDLTWTGFGNATSYNVLRGTSAGGENPVPIGSTTTTAYTDTGGLVKGTTYYYVVLPMNGGTAVCSSNETAVKAP
jgi:fibronectin type 3 domain-containing protein